MDKTIDAQLPDNISDFIKKERNNFLMDYSSSSPELIADYKVADYDSRLAIAKCSALTTTDLRTICSLEKSSEIREIISHRLKFIDSWVALLDDYTTDEIKKQIEVCYSNKSNKELNSDKLLSATAKINSLSEDEKLKLAETTTSQEELEVLLFTSSDEVVALAAKNPCISMDQLDKLLQNNMLVFNIFSTVMKKIRFSVYYDMLAANYSTEEFQKFIEGYLEKDYDKL